MNTTKSVNPWLYIPSVYFAEGLPYIVINAMAVAMYAKMGLPNDLITLWTGWLYLPWILKMFWSPLVDGKSTKRRWLLGCQFLLTLVFLWVAVTLQLGNFFIMSLFGLMTGAFISATQDISADGYYLIALTPQQQGKFVGIRTLFYRLAMLFGSGLLVMFAGKIETLSGNIPLSWTASFGILSVVFAVFSIYHLFILPKPIADKPAQTAKGLNVFADSFKTYFTQKNILYILAFILCYRLGDAMLEKIVVPFLLKPVSEGALAVSTQHFGLIKGTFCMLAIIAGNLTGGWLLGRFGFKKCIWYFALIMTLPNFFYVYLAYAQPSLWVVGLLLSLEQFGYGLALMAFMVFIMYVSQGKYKTSHYAISTGVMALGMMLPSMFSGSLQVWLGYKLFFVVTAVVSIGTLVVIPLALRVQSIEETEKAFLQTRKSAEEKV